MHPNQELELYYRTALFFPTREATRRRPTFRRRKVIAPFTTEANVRLRCVLNDRCRLGGLDEPFTKGYMFASTDYEDPENVECAANSATLEVLLQSEKHLELHEPSQQQIAELKTLDALRKEFDEISKALHEADQYMSQIWDKIERYYSGRINIELRDLHECTLGEGQIFKCLNAESRDYSDCESNKCKMLKGLSGYGTTEEHAKEHLVASLRMVIDDHANDHRMNKSSEKLREEAMDSEKKRKSEPSGDASHKRAKT